MTINLTPLADLFSVEGGTHSDQRGHFSRLFCELELKEILSDRHIVQVNRTVTFKKGAIRGLHFQYPPSAEMKLIRCLRGHVWDVAVDIRKGSPTYLQWHAVEMSADENKMLVLSEGFAHGFQTLSDSCEMLYLHTQEYVASDEAGLRWNDPRLAINWPIDPSDISARDHGHPLIGEHFEGVQL